MPQMKTKTTIAIALLMGGGMIATSACGARNGSSSPQTPVELQIGKISELQEAGAPSGDRGDARCSVKLVASRIEKSSPGCFLDEHISEGPGILRYSCGGDGPAEAEFGDHRYTGNINRGEVLVELATELDWEDGCRWGTLAAISGRVMAGGSNGSGGSNNTNNGKPTLTRLNWNYLDRVITGADCSGVCTARTSFAVSSKDAHDRNAEPEEPELDEDRD
jgi:hypothetical protein